MSIRAKQALTILIGIVVAVVMLLLGLWQMASFQRSMDDVAAERAEMPAVPLAPSVASDGTVEDIYGRRVTFTSTWLPEYHVLIGEQWPMRVAVLAQLTDGRHITVVLGTVDEASALESTLPAGLPVGELPQQGIFTAGDKVSTEPVAAGAPERSLPTLRLQSLVQTWPQPIISGYVTLSPEDSAAYGLGPAEVQLPEAQGSYMHQGYALQWWVFAGAAVAFSIFVARGFREPAKTVPDKVDSPGA